MHSAIGAHSVTSLRRHSAGAHSVAVNERANRDMVWLEGGTFTMGSDWHYPEEAPAHDVAVDGFWIDRCLVTNGEFSRFVRDTGYMTVAERRPVAEDYPNVNPESLQPASMVFRKPEAVEDMANHFNWWSYLPGACWRHPDGRGSNINERVNHPVVHVTYEDALAFTQWAGKDLPTEAEWEFAARGGMNGAEYAWGDEHAPHGRAMANTWHGQFPHENTGADGYESTSPVGAFPANGYGLYDMIGNVWEWTADWYEPQHRTSGNGNGGLLVNPQGGDRSKSYDPRMPDLHIPRKAVKGGSYLCAPNSSRRYRPAARMAQAIDTPACHIGFRCIKRG